MFFLDELYSVKAPPGWKKAPAAEQHDMIPRKGHKRNDSGGKRNSLFSLRTTDASASHGTLERRLSHVMGHIDTSSTSSNRSSMSLPDREFSYERSPSRNSGKSKKLSRLNRNSENTRSLRPVQSPGTIASTPSPRSPVDPYDIPVKRSTGPAPFGKFKPRAYFSRILALETKTSSQSRTGNV